MISVQPLREFEFRLRAYAEQARAQGDEVGATRLGEIANRAKALTNEAEAVLSRLGNPASDQAVA